MIKIPSRTRVAKCHAWIHQDIYSLLCVTRVVVYRTVRLINMLSCEKNNIDIAIVSRHFLIATNNYSILLLIYLLLMIYTIYLYDILIINIIYIINNILFILYLEF